MEELPNGFTGFANRKRTPGFESAGDAMRRSRSTIANGIQAPKGEFQYPIDLKSEDSDSEHVVKPYGEDELKSIGPRDRRWAWVEIDQAAIRHNTLEAKRHLSRGCRLMAVVKADGYGHGAVACAKASLSAGADYLGVATVQEALELRTAGLRAPLMLLAQPPETAIPLLLEYQVMPAIYDPAFAVAYGEAADLHGMVAPYHLAVNTGMNRIGVRYDDAVEFLRQVNFHRGIELAGVFTHFATADCPEAFDFDIQARRFVEAVSSIQQPGINPGIVHAANSAALFRYPEVHFDMARLGISLYGFHPCPETRRSVNLRPAMSVHARITDTRFVPMSEGVSYGLHYRSPGSVKICTIPLGYADGYRRGLSGNIDVVYGGRYHRQVGNICMDQCMFEVDMRSYATRERIDPQVGDEVIIVGRQGGAEVTIDEMSDKLGTIQHEIAIGFSHRLPRIFV